MSATLPAGLRAYRLLSAAAAPLALLLLAHRLRHGKELRARLSAPATNTEQALYVSGDLPTGRVMVKDEDLCVHCGLCAERCPTAAWDMRKSELLIPYAGTVSWPTQSTTG